MTTRFRLTRPWVVILAAVAFTGEQGSLFGQPLNQRLDTSDTVVVGRITRITPQGSDALVDIEVEEWLKGGGDRRGSTISSAVETPIGFSRASAADFARASTGESALYLIRNGRIVHPTNRRHIMADLGWPLPNDAARQNGARLDFPASSNQTARYITESLVFSDQRGLGPNHMASTPIEVVQQYWASLSKEDKDQTEAALKRLAPTRRTAALVLSAFQLSRHKPEGVPPYRLALSQRIDGAEEFARFLWEYRSPEPRALADLNWLAANASRRVRYYAVSGLAAIRLGQCLPCLVAALDDQDDAIRFYAVQGIAIYGLHSRWPYPPQYFENDAPVPRPYEPPFDDIDHTPREPVRERFKKNEDFYISYWRDFAMKRMNTLGIQPLPPGSPPQR